jgi:hypothetical protein
MLVFPAAQYMFGLTKFLVVSLSLKAQTLMQHIHGFSRGSWESNTNEK